MTSAKSSLQYTGDARPLSASLGRSRYVPSGWLMQLVIMGRSEIQSHARTLLCTLSGCGGESARFVLLTKWFV